MIKYFILGGIIGMIIKQVIPDMISANRESFIEIKEILKRGDE